jgi:hypothetical protein
MYYNSKFMNVQSETKPFLVVPQLEEDKKSQILVRFVEKALDLIVKHQLPDEFKDFTENLPYHVYNLPTRSQNALFWLEYAHHMRMFFWSENAPYDRDGSADNLLNAKILCLAIQHYMETQNVLDTIFDYMHSISWPNTASQDIKEFNYLKKKFAALN